MVTYACCVSQINVGLSTFFFFKDTATTDIYTLSLHDALPIYIHAQARCRAKPGSQRLPIRGRRARPGLERRPRIGRRSEEHTSELQSLTNLVCRLLLEKKKERGAGHLGHQQAAERLQVRRSAG